MRQAVDKCQARSVKLLTFELADQTGCIYFTTWKFMTWFGFLCGESEL